ncbi:MAG: rhodanese-like domain-containing protein [Desulfobacteraceae bacterium]|nr:rhodanese-like domain-containing protein [Desulfobacteraceae bacterium]
MKHFKGIIILFIISLTLSFFYNSLSPSGIALIGNWDRTKGVVSANKKNSSVEREREINSLDKMKEVVEKNKALIIDVRLEETFRKGHIPSAISIPISIFDELVGNFYESVAMEQEIIVYCSSRECTDSHSFAQKLSEFGYKDVMVFAGGFNDWEQGGGLVEKN